MRLEQQLRDSADQWLAEEQLSQQRAVQLEQLVRKAARRRRMAQAAPTAAVAAGIVVAVNWPAVLSVASELPIVGQFISRLAHIDRGAVWAEEKGFVAPVSKSASDKGYTVNIDSVAADASRTTVYFTIDGAGLNEHPVLTQDIDVRFDGVPQRFDTYGVMRWESVGGQIVGQLNLAPLPQPTAQVGINVKGINGVKGTWNVAFTASRSQLDPLTRTAAVDKRLQGDGYELRVHSVVMAPTETSIELSGTSKEPFELRGLELVADGTPVAAHDGDTGGIGGTFVQAYKLPVKFERLDGAPNSLTLRAKSVVWWRNGGPVIDLSKAGTRVEYNGVAFELDAINVVNGHTEIAVRLPGDDSAWKRAFADFHGWHLIDESGHEYQVNGNAWLPAQKVMRFDTDAHVTGSMRLEASSHAEPASGPIEIAIPLK